MPALFSPKNVPIVLRIMPAYNLPNPICSLSPTSNKGHFGAELLSEVVLRWEVHHEGIIDNMFMYCSCIVCMDPISIV